MRFNFRFLVAALMTIGSSYAIAQVDVIDRFDGTTLNSRWITAPGLFTKAGGSYRQTNGALNFTVATGSSSRVENNIHVLNTNTLPTDQSWSLVIGMHNSADYSSFYGSSQLQMGVLDLRTINSDFRGVVFTLARYRDLNGGNPLFGFYGTNLPKWYENGGIWTNANTNASARFEYNALTRTLQGFVTTDGVNPIDNTYNYFSAGPASSIPIPATAKLNLLVIQNVYSVAVPVGKMWVDNYKLSFAPLDGRLYPGLPATLSRRPGQDLFLSVSPRDNGTFTYDWKKNGQTIAPLAFGKHAYFKAGLQSADSGTYSVVVRRNGSLYASNQTVLTLTNTAPGPFGVDDFSTSSTRWSGLWGFDAHDSYLEVNQGQLDYVLDKAGSENSQAFQIWDTRLPSSQNWEVVVDTFIEQEVSPAGFFALRLGVAAPVSPSGGLEKLNGLEINFANSRYGGGKKIQNIKTIPTGDGWLELSQPALNQSTTAVALRMKWDAVTKVLTSYYDSNGATGGYVWTQSATNNLSSLPSSQLAAGFYPLVSGIAEPSFLLPAGQAYFKNFQVRTGPVILAQMVPQTAAEGGSVTFTAPGEGTGPISYQWRKNGVAIDGQTNSTLTLSGLTATDAGQYSVFISNALGTITSSNTLLTVIVPPGFPTQATNGLRVNLGSAFRYQPMITGSAAVFTSGNLPPGLSVNRTNGLITGTPTTAGYYRSALTASNFAGTGALRLNFTIPGSSQTLPFTDDFSRTNANRYMPLGFSGISAEARAGLTNGVLRFTCISNARAAELFPRPFGYGEEAVFGWAANLGLSVNRPWQIEADACVPESGLFGLAIYPDSLNSTVEQALPRRLNLYWHRTPTNSRGWLATSGWTVNGAGQQEEYDSPPMGHLNSGLTSSVVKLRLVMGISGANRLLTAWGTEDLTGRGGWSQIGQTLELSPGGTTKTDHYPLGQDWNLSTNSTFSLALFGQFGAAGQASWVDNLRVTVAVPPVITSTTNLIGQVGKASFSYSIRATNSPTSFAASNLPAGLGVDSSTGLITGTPTAAGSKNVVLYASSPAGTGSRTNLAIILPEFTSAATSSGSVNDTAFSHRVELSANNFGATLRFSALNLPTGTAINATSGVISGKPTVAGTYPTTVTITALGASASQRIDFTFPAALGGQYSRTLNPKPTNVTGLPAGLSYNRTTGVISGTPLTAGNFTAVGQLVGGGTINISIPVLPSVPVISSPTNMAAKVGQEFFYQIVPGGFGREWAGFDSFETTTSTNWTTSTNQGNATLIRPGGATGRLVFRPGTTSNVTQRSYQYWNRAVPAHASWLAFVDAFSVPTNPSGGLQMGLAAVQIEGRTISPKASPPQIRNVFWNKIDRSDSTAYQWSQNLVGGVPWGDNFAGRTDVAAYDNNGLGFADSYALYGSGLSILNSRAVYRNSSPGSFGLLPPICLSVNRSWTATVQVKMSNNWPIRYAGLILGVMKAPQPVSPKVANLNMNQLLAAITNRFETQIGRNNSDGNYFGYHGYAAGGYNDDGPNQITSSTVGLLKLTYNATNRTLRSAYSTDISLDSPSFSVEGETLKVENLDWNNPGSLGARWGLNSNSCFWFFLSGATEGTGNGNNPDRMAMTFFTVYPDGEQSPSVQGIDQGVCAIGYDAGEKEVTAFRWDGEAGDLVEMGKTSTAGWQIGGNSSFAMLIGGLGSGSGRVTNDGSLDNFVLMPWKENFIYGVEGTLPPGLIFDSDSGSITGQPTSPGTYNIFITVQGDGGRARQSVRIVVVN